MPPPTPPCPTRAGAGAEAACWRPRPHGAGRCRCGPLGHCHGVQRRRDGAHRPPQGPVKPRSSRRLSTAAWAVAAVVALCGVRQASALLVDYTGAHFNTRSTEYRNCKITQRCNDARLVLTDYELHLGLMEFTKDGELDGRGSALGRPEAIELFQDFENWRAGTMGFQVDQALLQGTLNATYGAHFNPFSFFEYPPLGPEDVQLQQLLLGTSLGRGPWSSFQLDTRANNPDLDRSVEYELIFNTTDCLGHLFSEQAQVNRTEGSLPFDWYNALDAVNRTYSESQFDTIYHALRFEGTITNDTVDGSYVCVWNFLAINLSPNTTVNIVGDKPMVLMSVSTAIIDTPLVLPPGQLGGLPRTVGPSRYQNNLHGPGSPALRAYWATVRTHGEDVNEVQSVTTGADRGQTLRGNFRLTYQGVTSGDIPHDATGPEMRRILESHWPLAGRLHVTRGPRDDEGGRTWTITFLTAVGNRPQVEVIDRLTGIGHRAHTLTLQDGNDISGSFRISFLEAVTRPIPVTSSAEEVRAIMEEDFAPVGLVNAEVVRSNPLGNACQAGLCPNGPQEAWGLTWSFTLVTHRGIVIPTSTLDDHPQYEDSIDPRPPTLHSFNITSSVPGAYANASFFSGFDYSEATGVPPHANAPDAVVTFPYGGFGGSYGGVGGRGHARHNAAPPYNDEVITELLGGSSGAMGGETVHQVLARSTFTPDGNLTTTSGPGAGGAGGGVLHIVAVNDVIVNRNGAIYAEGEPGEDAFRAGGGGSGGVVFVSAGGVFIVHSTVSVRGGDGGKGIGAGSRGGGGGGGGRIASFSQSLSIIDDGVFIVDGGTGGLDEELNNATAVKLWASRDATTSPTNTALYSGDSRPLSSIDGGRGSLNLVSGAGAQYRIELEEGGAQGTGRALRVEANDTILVENGVIVRSPYANNGPAFTFPRNGIFNVRRGVQAPESGEGGSTVHGGANPGLTPAKVTVYVKTQSPPHGALNSHWGAHIALHEFDYRPISNNTGEQEQPFEGNLPGATGGYGPGGPALAGGAGVPGDGGEGGGVGNDAAALIGVALVDGKFKHDSNYRHTPGIDLPADSPQTVAFRHVEADRWYKIDIFMDWQNYTYNVRVDDYTVVLDQPFNGSSLRRLGLYTFHQSVAWFDEVYVGLNNQRFFECPQTLADQSLRIRRPLQSGWDVSFMGPPTATWDETRHLSHIARREAFVKVPRQMGFEPNDGPPHLQFHSDVITRTPDGDHNATMGDVVAGAMTWVPVGRHQHNDVDVIWEHDAPPRDMEHKAYTLDAPGREWGSGVRVGAGAQHHGATGRFYWYGEHEINLNDNEAFASADLDTYDRRNFGPDVLPTQGGVMACSTNDMLSWRNEGVMLHNIAITDTRPFLSLAVQQTPLRTERPKVYWNNATQQYVMWMTAVDHDEVELEDDPPRKLIAVATADLPNGPWISRRTFLPDGNDTIDFTLLQDGDGTLFLVRTYYANKTYYLPEPIMQPVWESVKDETSTDFDPVVDYGLNYHRAFYHHLYDNTADTYLQRWRNEHLEWRIETGDWVETYNHAIDMFELRHVTTGQAHVVSPYTRGERQDILEAVFDDHTFRDIMGQGRPPILSRYKDPANADNSVWQPGSVPAVKPQLWSENYQDKNIADNPQHPTVADLLIGPARIVEIRRSKYLAISLVSDDYTDTVGVLTYIEGELENQDDLIVLLSEFGRFGLTGAGHPGADLRTTSTYPFDEDGRQQPFGFHTERDWLFRHWQFNNTRNDRYEVTGTLPEDPTITHHDTVNFRDEQVSTRCPELHYLAETKYNECEDLRNAQRLELLTPQVNAFQVLQSFAEAMSTAKYEACLVEHEAALKEYQDCVQAQLVDFNDLQPWGVGSRECVGGDGLCTRDPDV